MKKLRITVDNKTYDVTVEDLTEAESFIGTNPTTRPPTPPPQPMAVAARPQPKGPSQAGAVTCPMAGVIKSVLVKANDQVDAGQSLIVLEAMKMENRINAPAGGTVKSVHVTEGESVTEGHTLIILE